MSTSRVQPPTSSTAAASSRLRPLSRAFTLVELLLVISIIAILVSITIPALGSSRETSRRLKCLTNLKGLGVGFAVYMNDSKELLPRVRPLHDPSSGNTNDVSLLDVMAQYLSVPSPRRSNESDPNSPYISNEVFVCPSDRAGRDAATNFEPVWKSNGTSYEYLAGYPMEFLKDLLDDPVGAVSKTYAQPRWRELPVLLDNDDWHPGRKGGTPRNALYYGDWRADWAGSIVKFDSQDNRLRDLVCDMGRNGGKRFPGCD
ncbi:MAG: type II secretion system GspH family protein [Phycisphaerales bacterium]|nr:type II secretion system GspH family protein [Phycisphaerales bacterium]